MFTDDRITVRLTRDYRSRLERVAAAIGVQLTTAARDMIEKGIEEREKEMDSGQAATHSGRSLSVNDLSERERARQHYKPMKVKVLLVGESVPAGGDFFYHHNSHLFDATREGYQDAFGPMPHGIGFLDEFKEHGGWLYDVVSRPINWEPDSARDEAAVDGMEGLVRVLVAERPQLVVGVKVTLEGVVRQAARRAGLAPGQVQILPFPLYQWRSSFVKSLSSLLRSLEDGDRHSSRGSQGPPPGGGESDVVSGDGGRRLTLHEAMEKALRLLGGEASAREIANHVTRLGLYRRQDGGPVDYQQVLLRARHYPRLFERTPRGVRLLKPGEN